MSMEYGVWSMEYGENAITAMAAVLVSLNTLYFILNTATRGRSAPLVPLNTSYLLLNTATRGRL